MKNTKQKILNVVKILILCYSNIIFAGYKEGELSKKREQCDSLERNYNSVVEQYDLLVERRNDLIDKLELKEKEGINKAQQLANMEDEYNTLGLRLQELEDDDFSGVSESTLKKIVERSTALYRKMESLEKVCDKIFNEIQTMQKEIEKLEKKTKTLEEKIDKIQNDYTKSENEFERLEKEIKKEVEDKLKKELEKLDLFDNTSPSCFIEGTHIETTEGVKDIKDVKEGDYVMSCNLQDNNKCEARRVDFKIEQKADKLVKIQKNNLSVFTTLNHEIYLNINGRQELLTAQELAELTKERLEEVSLIRKDGEDTSIDSVTIVDLEESVTVYDLNVKVNHNYYVFGYLVHNCGSDDNNQKLFHAAKLTATALSSNLCIVSGAQCLTELAAAGALVVTSSGGIVLAGSPIIAEIGRSCGQAAVACIASSGLISQMVSKHGSNVVKKVGEDPTPESVLENMSKNNLKHSQKHLSEFQKLDPKITAESLRKLGASLVKKENLISNLGTAQKAYQAIVKIGNKNITVRAVLNELEKLHSIHIRYK